MTTLKGSDNPFPSILFEEHVDPATPPSGHWRLFMDTDNIFKLIDDAGTVTTVGGSAVTRASLGLDTTDNPQFAGINVGHASDTTLNRVSAGVLQVEGNRLFAVGGADVPIADGGTGASTATAAFDALSPMTTAGDLIIGGASGTRTRLAAGATSGHVLTSTGSASAPAWQAAAGVGGLTTAYQVATSDTSITGGAAAADVNGASITLAAGTWWIDAEIVYTNSGAVTGYLRGSITTAANTVVGVGRGIEANLGSANAVGFNLSAQVTPGSSTTYKLRAESDDNSTVIYQDLGVAATWIRAIKVA